MLRSNAATLWAHVIWRSGTTVPNSQSHPIPWSTQFHCKGINSVQYSNWQLFSEYQKGATPCLLCKMKVLGSCCDLHATDTTSQQRWIIFPLPMIVFTIHLEGRYGVIPSNISACKSRRYQPVWRCALPCKFVLSTPQSFNSTFLVNYHKHETMRTVGASKTLKWTLYPKHLYINLLHSDPVNSRQCSMTNL